MTPTIGLSQIGSRPPTSMSVMSGTSSVAMPKFITKVDTVPFGNPLTAMMQPGASPGSVLSSWLKALLGYGARWRVLAHIFAVFVRNGHPAKKVSGLDRHGVLTAR